MIIDSYATGVVRGRFSLGGLVGDNSSGSAISDCYATGPVTGTAAGVGGLVGNNIAMITDSYAAGAVSGDSSLGGLVGKFNGDTISNCYAVGRVAGFVSDGGGLVGENIAGTISNSFWDTQTSGQASSGGGMGKTTAQMKQQATFTGWDFIEPWGIFENQTYSLLKTLRLCIQDGTGHPPGDINGDCLYDMLDLAILIQFWLADKNWRT